MPNFFKYFSQSAFLCLFILLTHSSDSLAQVNQITFNMEQIDLLKGPRTNISWMSMKLWDNYKGAGGPTDSGTVLEIYGRAGHQTGQLYFGGYDNSKIRYREAFYAQNEWSEWVTLLDSKNNVESAGNLILKGTGNSSIKGNLLIGAESQFPGARLTVGGMIACKELKIDIAAGADFVFDEAYKLKDLELINAFIQENNHLPDIPSEAVMKKEGLNVNEFQIKLLQKIEELTLYSIQQNEQIKQLQDIITRNGLK
ncbi:hypothetical protein CLV62_12450 [Dysgonomonas alginatilytica]|uniref:LamG domain-containing protein n=1 Tax=Dysgonomonas alginatilytica TaxID=1605892 RepID=A0A2V3PM68_9BACT|nr:hypothetical protein [Dysgonomonas alginatilytica]PXV61895.1 hypothetical protein CLV62_12450 [Dysgonomonas alginatilytica]